MKKIRIGSAKGAVNKMKIAYFLFAWMYSFFSCFCWIIETVYNGIHFCDDLYVSIAYERPLGIFMIHLYVSSVCYYLSYILNDNLRVQLTYRIIIWVHLSCVISEIKLRKITKSSHFQPHFTEVLNSTNMIPTYVRCEMIDQLWTTKVNGIFINPDFSHTNTHRFEPCIAHISESGLCSIVLAASLRLFVWSK